MSSYERNPPDQRPKTAKNLPRGRGKSGSFEHPVPSWPPQLDDQYYDYMTTIMTASEIKAKLLAVLDEVADGAEVEITKHGRVVARLVPAGPRPARAGVLTGVARSVVADEDLFMTGERWESS
jgi:prevent-host-death family protein